MRQTITISVVNSDTINKVNFIGTVAQAREYCLGLSKANNNKMISCLVSNSSYGTCLTVLISFYTMTDYRNIAHTTYSEDICYSDLDNVYLIRTLDKWC